MFKRLTQQEKDRRAVRAELDVAADALRANEKAFQEALDPFVIEQLTYQHAALLCRCRRRWQRHHTTIGHGAHMPCADERRSRAPA